MTRVFIDGAAGTTGLEIRERLSGHGAITVATLPPDRRRDPGARAAALNAADIVVLCLPDDAAREAVALITNPAVKIVDASTAHRVDPDWVYGLPELEPGGRAAIAGAARVSNPGCYPTGFLALVRPLVRAGLIPAGYPLSVNAVSGYSGGGKAMIAAYEEPLHPASPVSAYRGYALDLAHKHLGEMRVHAGLVVAPVFAPAVVNTYRGMVVEVPLHLAVLPGQPAPDRLRDAIAATYEDSAVVQVATRAASEALGSLTVEHAAGHDRLDIHVFANSATGHVRLVAALDNLGKGAAGAAVQNVNLLAGLPETTGLRL